LAKKRTNDDRLSAEIRGNLPRSRKQMRVVENPPDPKLPERELARRLFQLFREELMRRFGAPPARRDFDA